MKKREFGQLKNKPEAELKTQLSSLRDKLWELRRDLAAGKVKNVSEIRKIKRDIARVITLLHE